MMFMCIMTSGVRKAIKQIFGTNVHFVIDERASKIIKTISVILFGRLLLGVIVGRGGLPRDGGGRGGQVGGGHELGLNGGQLGVEDDEAAVGRREGEVGAAALGREGEMLVARRGSRAAVLGSLVHF